MLWVTNSPVLGSMVKAETQKRSNTIMLPSNEFTT